MTQFVFFQVWLAIYSWREAVNKARALVSGGWLRWHTKLSFPCLCLRRVSWRHGCEGASPPYLACQRSGCTKFSEMQKMWAISQSCGSQISQAFGRFELQLEELSWRPRLPWTAQVCYLQVHHSWTKFIFCLSHAFQIFSPLSISSVITWIVHLSMWH